MTPDQLTRQYYIDKGYHITKVETWKMHPELRRADFLGIYDYLAYNDDETIAIQTTTKHNMLARRKKMLSKKTFAWWTVGKNRRSVLHGWYKNKSNRWDVVEEELTMDDWNAYQQKLKDDIANAPINEELQKMLWPDG